MFFAFAVTFYIKLDLLLSHRRDRTQLPAWNFQTPINSKKMRLTLALGGATIRGIIIFLLFESHLIFKGTKTGKSDLH